MAPSSRSHVAGHRGLVGSAIVRRLRAAGHADLLLRTHAELDLTDEHATRAFSQAEQPEYVFPAAAKVGASWPTTLTRPSSSATTWRSRPM